MASVSEWPPIAEPELLRRMAMDSEEFEEYLLALLETLPQRAFVRADYVRAVGYPWARPEGPYLLTDGEVELIDDLPVRKRADGLGRLISPEGGRVPLVAIGSNATPAVLEAKFAHFADPEDRTLLALPGRLRDFDVGVAAQPALYGSLPATIFPSPVPRYPRRCSGSPHGSSPSSPGRS